MRKKFDFNLFLSITLLLTFGVVLKIHWFRGPSDSLYPLSAIDSSDELITEKRYRLERLSEIFQKQLHQLQNNDNCNAPNILCGHFSGCGFGCQIHHRASCVMMSYALQIPLIHDLSAWQYEVPWSHIFQPLGISCSPGPNTLYWDWRTWNGDTKNANREFINNDTFGLMKLNEYPLEFGIVVPADMGDIVEIELGVDNAFVWWVGQFIKYTMRLNETYRKKHWDHVQKELDELQPFLGCHIRRTDKITENIHSHHDIYEYLTQERVNDFLRRRTPTTRDWRKAFLASDDMKAIEIEQKKFPSWEFRRFEVEDYWTEESRRNEHALNEIIRDTLALSEAEVIVCGHSSNVCRLVYEIRASKTPHFKETLINLDEGFVYDYTLFNAQTPLLVLKDSHLNCL